MASGLWHDKTMQTIYENQNGKLTPLEFSYPMGMAERAETVAALKGPNTLVDLVNPTDAELAIVANACGGIDIADLRSAFDDEEPSRVEVEDGYTLLVLDVPVREEREHGYGYQTYPLSIIVTQDDVVIAISVYDFQLLDRMTGEMRRRFLSADRPHFVYGMLTAMALKYQRFLRDIEARRANLVNNLGDKTTKDDLLELHSLETDIVYFETSLNSNRIVMHRAARSTMIVSDEIDEDLLNDVLIEIDQAAEMASVYRKLIASTRDLFGSVMDNDLNNTMKVLTCITVILAIPTLIAGFFGMNVASESMPFSASPFGFAIIAGITVVLCLVALLLLRRKKLL